MEKEFDLAVIGSGPGGYVAAIKGAQLGLKTAIIESDNLGGICLNWGCIPTKALLKSSHLYHDMQRANDFGISIGSLSFDMKKIVSRSRAAAEKLSAGIAHLLKKNKITLLKGKGQLAGSGKILITDINGKQEQIKAKHIIIATGARSRILPGFEVDGKSVLSSKEAMIQDDTPKSLLVIGAGAIGCEFASFYNDLGADVTLIEMSDRILPVEDEDVSHYISKSYTSRNIKVKTNVTAKSYKKAGNKLNVIIEDKKGTIEEIKVDKIITAVGVVGNHEGLGIEKTKIKLDRGYIKVNQWLETDEKNIYAIGDIAGPPWLAHKASHEAIICVEKIAGVKNVKPLTKELIPGCTYCRPEVASVGFTEKQAQDLGYKLKIGKFPFTANGRMIASGDEDGGFIKTIFDEKTGQLLGAHMVGYSVTEMIGTMVVAMNLETTEEELMHSVFAHPTASEAIHESVLSAFGLPIHI